MTADGDIRHDHAGRLSRARSELERAGLAGLVVSPSADLMYLAGYDALPLERLTALVVRWNQDPVLLVPRLEEPRAAASPAGGLMEIKSWPDGDDPYEAAGRLLGGGACAVSDRMFAMHLLGLQRSVSTATFVSASAVMSSLRIRKDAAEITLLQRAGESADRTFDLVTDQGLDGRTEREVSRALAATVVETGCDSAAFGIVGSGPNGASPHHEPGDRVIEAGDTVVLDFGGRAGGYCSDLSRTVTVGEPSAQVKEVHAVVREAQEAAFLAARPGVAAQELDRTARRIIAEAGYGDRFIHRTGHGIGLDEHEDPYVVEGNEQALEPGMCFSVEPGIYLPDRFGVRIEDIVTMTEDGARRLNEAPRDLKVVA